MLRRSCGSTSFVASCIITSSLVSTPMTMRVRLCGTVTATAAAGGQVPSSQSSNAAESSSVFLSRGRRVKCRDWICPHCQFLNFHGKYCYECGLEPGDGVVMEATPQAVGPTGTVPPQQKGSGPLPELDCLPRLTPPKETGKGGGWKSRNGTFPSKNNYYAKTTSPTGGAAGAHQPQWKPTTNNVAGQGAGASSMAAASPPPNSTINPQASSRPSSTAPVNHSGARPPPSASATASPASPAAVRSAPSVSPPPAAAAPSAPASPAAPKKTLNLKIVKLGPSK